MNVGSLLDDKGYHVVTIGARRTVLEASQLMREKRIGVLVVVDGYGPQAGTLSERDIVDGIARLGAAVLDAPVVDVMNPTVTTCEPTMSVVDVMTMMA